MISFERVKYWLAVSAGSDLIKFSDLNAVADNMRREIDEKNGYIGSIEKQKNDAEWSLGEHRQWLQDTKNRYTENSLKLNGAESSNFALVLKKKKDVKIKCF